MKYLTIDLETTGLDTREDQVLEIGAVVDDIPRGGGNLTPLEELPRFRAVLRRDRVEGHPMAMAMHGDLFRYMHAKKPADDVCSPADAVSRFESFLCQHFPVDPAKNQARVTIAGKNVGGFDMEFLSRLPRFRKQGGEVHLGLHVLLARVIDPGTLFFWPDFDEYSLPGTDEIMRRCGIEETSDHTAVGDCLLVVRAIRAYFTTPGLQWSPNEWTCPGGKRT